MFRLNHHSRRLKNGRCGFSLVELIVVILIIAILAVAVFAGGSAAIRKANKAKALSDLRNFQIAVTLTMGEHPEIANINASTKRDKLKVIMDALNDNLPKGYKVTLQTTAMDGNINMDEQTDVNADFIICKSEKTDAWDNPYFVIIDSAQRGGSALSEFYMTTVSAGPNAILNITGSVDKDDVFDLSSYADGDVKSEIYDIAEAAPTVVGGTVAATSFTDPAAAPVNNGVTVVAQEIVYASAYDNTDLSNCLFVVDVETSLVGVSFENVTVVSQANMQLENVNFESVSLSCSNPNSTSMVITSGEFVDSRLALPQTTTIHGGIFSGVNMNSQSTQLPNTVAPGSALRSINPVPTAALYIYGGTFDNVSFTERIGVVFSGGDMDNNPTETSNILIGLGYQVESYQAANSTTRYHVVQQNDKGVDDNSDPISWW